MTPERPLPSDELRPATVGRPVGATSAATQNDFDESLVGVLCQYRPFEVETFNEALMATLAAGRRALPAVLAALGEVVPEAKTCVGNILEGACVPPTLLDQALASDTLELRILGIVLAHSGSPVGIARSRLWGQMIRSPHPLAVQAAAIALAQIASRLPEERFILVLLLNDTKENCYHRASAASVLGWVRPVSEHLVDVLLRALRDRNCEVRASAAHALGNLRPKPEHDPDASVLPALRQVLNRDENYRVAAWAAYALGRIDPDAALPDLIRAANIGQASSPWDEVNLMHEQAALALAHSTQVDVALQALLANSHGVAGPAIAHILRQSESRIPQMMPFLSDRSLDFRYVLNVAQALRHLGPRAEGTVPGIIEILHEVDGFNRFQVLVLLQSLDHTADPATLALKHGFLATRERMQPSFPHVYAVFAESNCFIEQLKAAARMMLQNRPPLCTVEELVQTALGFLYQYLHKPSFRLRPAAHRAFASWLKRIRSNLLEDAYRHLTAGMMQTFGDLGRDAARDPFDARELSRSPCGASRLAARSDAPDGFVTDILDFLKERLTPVELQVLQLRLEGCSDSEIAERLGTSRWIPYSAMQVIRDLVRRNFGGDLPGSFLA